MPTLCIGLDRCQVQVLCEFTLGSCRENAEGKRTRNTRTFKNRRRNKERKTGGGGVQTAGGTADPGVLLLVVPGSRGNVRAAVPCMFVSSVNEHLATLPAGVLPLHSRTSLAPPPLLSETPCFLGLLSAEGHTSLFCFLARVPERETEIVCLCFTLRLASPGQSQELRPCLPCVWQGPRHRGRLLLLFPGHQQGHGWRRTPDTPDTASLPQAHWLILSPRWPLPHLSSAGNPLCALALLRPQPPLPQIRIRAAPCPPCPPVLHAACAQLSGVAMYLQGLLGLPGGQPVPRAGAVGFPR